MAKIENMVFVALRRALFVFAIIVLSGTAESRCLPLLGALVDTTRNWIVAQVNGEWEAGSITFAHDTEISWQNV